MAFYLGDKLGTPPGVAMPTVQNQGAAPVAMPVKPAPISPPVVAPAPNNSMIPRTQEALALLGAGQPYGTTQTIY